MKLQKEQENEKLESLKIEFGSLRLELENSNLKEEISELSNARDSLESFFQEQMHDKILENQKLWEKNRLLLEENAMLKREYELDDRCRIDGK